MILQPDFHQLTNHRKFRSRKQLEAGDPAEITFGLQRFAIEVIELDDTGGAQ